MTHNRYTLRMDDDGSWTIVDIFTDFPAEFGDQLLVRMDPEEAEEMVDLLNLLDRQRRAQQAGS